MIDQFVAYIRQHDLLQPGERLLIALSGGLDSVVLLHLLQRLAADWPLHLTAAHFNHQLRGEMADADEQFVIDLCASQNLPCFTGRGEVHEQARRRRSGIEAAARELRYSFLHETALSQGCSAILTAHHAGDQAETVLDHLLRGAGARGLAGMAPSSTLPPLSDTARSSRAAAPSNQPEPSGTLPPSIAAQSGPCRTAGAAAGAVPGISTPEASLRLVRPLLFARRADLAAYAAANGLAYREDSSNLDLRYRRNRIRHELLPQLAAYNPRIEEALGRMADHLREVNDFLDAEALTALRRIVLHHDDEKIILEKKSFLLYFSLLQKLVLQKSWSLLGGNPAELDAMFFRQLADFFAGGRYDRGLRLGRGEIWLTARHLVILGPRAMVAPLHIPARPGVYPLWEGRALEIKAVTLPLHEAELRANPRDAMIDAALLDEQLEIRPVQRGERFQPLGMAGHKRVAVLLAEANVPVYERDHWPMLCSGEQAVWLCGVRLADAFRITPATKRVYHLRMKRDLGASFRI